MKKKIYIIALIIIATIITLAYHYSTMPTEKGNVLLESYYAEGHQPATLVLNNRLSQSFLMRQSETYNITKVVFYLHVPSLGGTGDVYASLCTVHPSSGEPDTLLEYSDPVDIEMITTTSRQFTFTFDGTTPLDFNTRYHIVLDTDGVLRVGHYPEDVYDNGERWTWSSGYGWTSQTHDFAFELWGRE